MNKRDSSCILQLKDVEKIYPMVDTELKVLDKINLCVKRGERLAIIGPSGSGKSTLLHMIGCLDKPSRGSVLIDSNDISTMDEDRLAAIRREKIGFVFQFFFLVPSLNALQNVMLPMTFSGLPAHEKQQRAQSLLTLVGLGDRMYHMPSQLSGGQRQRVAIARALSNHPEIILADEPTGNLDSKSGKEVVEFLVNLNKKRGTTLIIITHDQAIASYAERIIHLKDGKIERDDAVANRKPYRRYGNSGSQRRLTFAKARKDGVKL